MGGNNIVEIDETKIGAKRKYNRGRANNGLYTWVFGLYERNTRLCVVYIVADQTWETLIPLIQRHVTPGSTIYSDMWPSYHCITALGYDHHMVNHSEEFVTAGGVNRT